jgi:hypothetical protein
VTRIHVICVAPSDSNLIKNYIPNMTKNWTPWPLVRKRTISTEWQPLVGEVSANFSG